MKSKLKLKHLALISGIIGLISMPSFADSQEDIQSRIKKVGQLNVASPATKEATTTAAPASPTETPKVANTTIDGETLYASKCAACHASGVMSAPILGNAEQWSARIAQGTESLYSHAIDGFNTMPAKGGAADLNDDQVKAIVDFMVSRSQ